MNTLKLYRHALSGHAHRVELFLSLLNRDYELVDVNGSFDIGRGLEVYGRIENLLDEDYEEIPTYNTSGTAAYAGLRYSF